MTKFAYLHPLLQADSTDPLCDVESLKKALRAATLLVGFPKSIVSPYDDDDYRVHGLLFTVHDRITDQSEYAVRVLASKTGFTVHGVKWDSEDFCVVSERSATLDDVLDAVCETADKLRGGLS